MALKEMKAKIDLTKYIEEHMFCFDNVFDECDDNQKIY
jgi:kinesin family protein 2/24